MSGVWSRRALSPDMHVPLALKFFMLCLGDVLPEVNQKHRNPSCLVQEPYRAHPPKTRSRAICMTEEYERAIIWGPAEPLSGHPRW